MTLQDVTVRTNFVNDCRTIWQNWLQGGPGGNRALRREGEFTNAINRMASFMVVPTVSFKHMSKGWGSFDWTKWKLKVNDDYTQEPDIKYKDFVELCCTVYHETRHGEQFYRIAQGLSAGDLKYPDASPTQVGQMAKTGTGSVRSRINMFQSMVSGNDPLQVDPGKRPGIIAKWIDIPVNIAQHADAARAGFQVYTSLAKPAWFKRATVLDEVNEWMRATYKKTYSEMDDWAQSSKGPYRIYRDLPEENDAHGIEDLVKTALYAAIGNDTPQNREKGRNDPVFGP